MGVDDGSSLYGGRGAAGLVCDAYVLKDDANSASHGPGSADHQMDNCWGDVCGQLHRDFSPSLLPFSSLDRVKNDSLEELTSPPDSFDLADSIATRTSIFYTHHYSPQAHTCTSEAFFTSITNPYRSSLSFSSNHDSFPWSTPFSTSSPSPQIFDVLSHRQPHLSPSQSMAYPTRHNRLPRRHLHCGHHFFIRLPVSRSFNIVVHVRPHSKFYPPSL